MSNFKIGDQVIYERYGFHFGVIERVGESTVGIKDESGWVEKRVEFRNIFPATPENLTALQQIKDIGREIEAFKTPLEREQDILKAQIRKTRQV